MTVSYAKPGIGAGFHTEDDGMCREKRTTKRTTVRTLQTRRPTKGSVRAWARPALAHLRRCRQSRSLRMIQKSARRKQTGAKNPTHERLMIAVHTLLSRPLTRWDTSRNTRTAGRNALRADWRTVASNCKTSPPENCGSASSRSKPDLSTYTSWIICNALYSAAGAVET